MHPSKFFEECVIDNITLNVLEREELKEKLKSIHPRNILGSTVDLFVIKVEMKYETGKGNTKVSEKYTLLPLDTDGYDSLEALYTEEKQKIMTPLEAMLELEKRVKIEDYKDVVPEYYEALKMAICALKKQIPMKPIEHETPDDYSIYACPYCTTLDVERHEYCNYCGQKIDRSELNE